MTVARALAFVGAGVVITCCAALATGYVVARRMAIGFNFQFDL